MIQPLASSFDAATSQKTIYQSCLEQKSYQYHLPGAFTYQFCSDSPQSKYIPMPPPNITGRLHLGHALFLTIQDSLTRFYKSCGHTTLWCPGLDHAGLATHDKIIAYQQKSDCCYEEASQYIHDTHKDIIITQIQKMAALPDWDMLTYTMDESYQSFALKILKLLHEDNRIYFKDGQFFLDIKDLAAQLKTDIEQGLIRIIPQTECAELFHFLDNIEDWCISRQIPWGIPLPLKQGDAGLELIDGYKSGHCLDTWFNSSLWPLACLLQKPQLIQKFYPAQLIETGADILFFWCAKMLMMGNYIHMNQQRLGLNIPQKYPFKDIYLHGLIRDKHNRKFSKSLGNGIDPLEMIDKYGSDALRLFLISRTGPAQDMKFNEALLPGIKKFGNKIWQASRFFSLYAHQYGLQKLDSHADFDEPILQEIQQEFIKLMTDYRFLEASRLIQHQFKAWFCDCWIEEHKQAIQSGDKGTLTKGLSILHQMLAMLHPFCPTITLEIGQQLYTNP